MILRTVEQLPHVTRWVAMVQHEVGVRFAAEPGTAAYGVPSVLAQLACEVKVLRAVSRTVFLPAPNVDSVLVGLTRSGPAPDPELRRLVQHGFAHRRKALARSVALGGGDARPRPRRARGDGPARRRSRRVAGARRLARAPRSSDRAVTVLVARAPGKVNLSLFVGAPARRRPAPAGLGRAGRLAGRRADPVAGGRRRRRGRLPGRRGAEPRRPRARAVPRGDRLGGTAAAPAHRQARPGRGRHGRRLGRRSGRAAARGARGRRRRRRSCCTSSPSSSAPTSRASSRPAAC